MSTQSQSASYFRMKPSRWSHATLAACQHIPVELLTEEFLDEMEAEMKRVQILASAMALTSEGIDAIVS